jgi:hypothetical protein
MRHSVVEVFDAIGNQPFADEIQGVTGWLDEVVHFLGGQVLAITLVIGIRDCTRFH